MRPFDKKLGSATLKVDIVGVKSLHFLLGNLEKLEKLENLGKLVFMLVRTL